MARATEDRKIGEKTLRLTQMKPTEVYDGMTRIGATFGKVLSAYAEGHGTADMLTAYSESGPKDAENAWLRAKFMANTLIVEELAKADGSTSEITRPLRDLDAFFDGEDGAALMTEWFIASAVLNYGNFIAALTRLALQRQSPDQAPAESSSTSPSPDASGSSGES